jgi:hypothetical protein
LAVPLDAVLAELDADRALALEQHLAGQGVGLDLEVGTVHGRMQIGHRRRAALAVLDRQLVVGRALLGRAVDVIVARDAGLLAGLDHRVRDGLLGR